ncbi:MAG: GNAT family N-acetyltransferase [Methylotenera sp.]
MTLSYRKHGIGKQLLQHVLEWAKTKGATRAQLLVDITNIEALRTPTMGIYSITSA